MVGRVEFEPGLKTSYSAKTPEIRQLNPDQRFGPQEIERLADHIAKFSVAALKGWES